MSKTRSDLLNEVIADAKAVRESAMQAAVASLKESFQPTVRNLISAKLSEEEEEFDDVAPTPPSTIPTDKELSEYEFEDDMSEEEDFSDIDFDDEITEEEDFDDFDVELDEILRELEEDPAHIGSDLSDPLDEEEGFEDFDDELTEEEGDESEIDLDIDVSEDDLDEMIRVLESDLRNRNRRGRRNTSTRRRVSETRKSSRFNSKLVSENKKLKKALKESYRAITKQKAVISEVNLLNSKLIYLQKIDSRFKLNGSSKIKVLEAFDRANTVREVKLVYATIVENMTAKRNASSKRRKMTESASSRKPVLKPRGNKGFDFSNRWQELAGMK